MDAQSRKSTGHTHPHNADHTSRFFIPRSATFPRNQASAITQTFKIVNDLIQCLKDTADVCPIYPCLYLNSIHIIAYSDSSFSTSTQVSQRRIFVFLVDKHKKCHLLHWSSVKCSSSTRSIIAAELYVFSVAFDYAHAAKDLLQK